MTNKYRKKPVVIEAYQTDTEVDIETLEGVMHASIGDYIITGVSGERYPCKPDIFAQTYDYVGPSLKETHDKRTETQEFKQEFLRMASYIDCLLECSDEQKKTLMNFIARLSEYMPWYEDDDFEVDEHTPKRTETRTCDYDQNKTHGDVISRSGTIMHFVKASKNYECQMLDLREITHELWRVPSVEPEQINPCTICQEFDCYGCKFRRTT